jgi:hypothetical protein
MKVNEVNFVDSPANLFDSVNKATVLHPDLMLRAFGIYARRRIAQFLKVLKRRLSSPARLAALGGHDTSRTSGRCGEVGEARPILDLRRRSVPQGHPPIA